MEGKKNVNLTEKNSVEYIKNMRDNLLIHMESQDLTTKELSEKSGVPLSTLNKILYADQNDCKLSTAVLLAKSLGISIDELVSAGTIDETVLGNIITCRSLPRNSIYLIRWFIKHQMTLHTRDNVQGKKIISVMEPLYTNDGILKVTNKFRQIDISGLSDDLKHKVFLGLLLKCDFFMPNYSPYDVLLLANDRNPFPREHVLILVKDNIFIANMRIENGIKKFYGIRDGRFRCDENDVSEIIGYITYVVPDTTEDGNR